MSVSTLVPKQQAAITVSRDFDKGRFPKTMQIDGDMAANTIVVKYVGIDGDVSSGTTAYDKSGTAIEFSATRTGISIYAPCKIVIIKGVTTNAVGIQLVEVG